MRNTGHPAAWITLKWPLIGSKIILPDMWVHEPGEEPCPGGLCSIEKFPNPWGYPVPFTDLFQGIKSPGQWAVKHAKQVYKQGCRITIPRSTDYSWHRMRGPRIDQIMATCQAPVCWTGEDGQTSYIGEFALPAGTLSKTHAISQAKTVSTVTKWD